MGLGGSGVSVDQRNVGASSCNPLELHGRNAADRRSPDHEPAGLRRRRAVHELACAPLAESTSSADRYLPAAFGKIHPRWKTPYISILVQAGVSGAILLVSQINETTRGAYQILIDAAIILYFIPFLYMFAAAIKLAHRRDRKENPHAVLVPGGMVGA